MEKTLIALHQMHSGTDPVENFETMKLAIGKAAGQGAGFYFAPEMSLLLDRKRSHSAANVVLESDSLYVPKLRALAAETGIWLHIGSLPFISETDDSRWTNRSLVIDNKGNIVARYDKMHLFDVDLSTGESWLESKAYAPGDNPVLADTPLGQMGLTICYDLRFADLYSVLSRAGADIIAIPSAFTVPTGKAHWHSLIRARAIESQAYVVAAAQFGKHEDGRVTYGHSLVVDPWGEVLLDMDEGEGLGFAEIDHSRIAEVRAQIPAHKNRRDIGEVKRF